MCRQGIDDIIITLNLQDDKMRNQVSPPPCTDVDIWPIDFARWPCYTATIHTWLPVSERHHNIHDVSWVTKGDGAATTGKNKKLQHPPSRTISMQHTKILSMSCVQNYPRRDISQIQRFDRKMESPNERKTCLRGF